MAETDQERTEEATDTRREEFRRRGQVAFTRELSSVFLLLGSALLLWGLGRFFILQLSQTLTVTLQDFVIRAARQGQYDEAIRFCAWRGFLVIAPLAGMLGILSVLANLVQTGLLNNEEALNIDFNRINPLEGFKRIFSVRALVEGLKAVLKVGLITLVVYLILRAEVKSLPQWLNSDLPTTATHVGTLVLRLLGGIGAMMIVLSGSDYFFQRWELDQRMRMTKQEVKEEHKSLQGDPLVKARIRRVQRDLANKRMMEDVPKGDVVITNPTHIAVVLKYDSGMVAPKLLAKGADLIAEKIKAVAKEHRIPIVENKPLARTIFKTMKIGQIIPRELFTAVAEVLSYVYKLKKRAWR